VGRASEREKGRASNPFSPRNSSLHSQNQHSMWTKWEGEGGIGAVKNGRIGLNYTRNSFALSSICHEMNFFHSFLFFSRRHCLAIYFLQFFFLLAYKLQFMPSTSRPVKLFFRFSSHSLENWEERRKYFTFLPLFFTEKLEKLEAELRNNRFVPNSQSI
jgi:hypothetical protein